MRAELNEKLPVTGLAMLGEEPQPFMFHFPGLLRNVPVLEEAAAGRGLFTITPERDGIVRRVPMIMLAQGLTMPSLSFEMLRVASGSGTILIKADKAGIQSLGVRGFSSRPIAMASYGCIMRAPTRRSTSRPSMCWKGASRRTGSRASLW